MLYVVCFLELILLPVSLLFKTLHLLRNGQVIVFLFTTKIFIFCFCVDVRTFEILLRTYEVREGKLDGFQDHEGGSVGSLPFKRRQRSSEASNEQETTSAPIVMARPCSEAKGHTGYLTFARLKCLS